MLLHFFLFEVFAELFSKSDRIPFSQFLLTNGEKVFLLRESLNYAEGCDKIGKQDYR